MILKPNSYQRVESQSTDLELTHLPQSHPSHLSSHSHTHSHTYSLNERDEEDIEDLDLLEDDEIEPEFTLVDTIPIVRVQQQSSIWSTKTYCYILLFISLLVISGAGTLMKKLPDTPPILRAFWRLFVLSLILFPGFLYQLRNISQTVKTIYFTKYTAGLMMISALSSAAHFG